MLRNPRSNSIKFDFQSLDSKRNVRTNGIEGQTRNSVNNLSIGMDCIRHRFLRPNFETLRKTDRRLEIEGLLT